MVVRGLIANELGWDYSWRMGSNPVCSAIFKYKYAFSEQIFLKSMKKLTIKLLS